jgi:uncharacterized protein (DUF2147 family)
MNATPLYPAHTALLLAASACFAVVWVKPGSDVKAKVGQRLFYNMRRDGTRSRSGKAVNPASGLRSKAL